MYRLTVQKADAHQDGEMVADAVGVVDRCGIIYNTRMEPYQVVLDTNVVFSALLSNQGASHKLLSLVGVSDRFQINLSVPLVLEYEDVLKRQSDKLGLSHQEIDDVLDYLCSVAQRRRIFYLWRTVLRDPKDEFVLELAVEGGCDFIITYNERDFSGAKRFGLQTMTPRGFLRLIEVLT
jgi:putative PIN family toxin of toxin-antitoxin system